MEPPPIASLFLSPQAKVGFSSPSLGPQAFTTPTETVPLVCKYDGEFVEESDKIIWKGGLARSICVSRSIGYSDFILKMQEVSMSNSSHNEIHIRYKHPDPDFGFLDVINGDDIPMMLGVFPRLCNAITVYIMKCERRPEREPTVREDIPSDSRLRNRRTLYGRKNMSSTRTTHGASIPNRRQPQSGVKVHRRNKVIERSIPHCTACKRRGHNRRTCVFNSSG
ncbi:hypothetical protein AMTRI_Chr03g147300 [Amborella trichopoda]